MKRFLLVLVGLAYAYLSVSAEIVELKSLTSLENFIDTSNPLILFDVNNTLVHKNPDLKGFEYAAERLNNKSFKLHWFFVEPMESDALPIIKRLQKKYDVLILTKNRNLLNYYKFFQLHTLGLDFSQVFPHIPFYYIKNDQHPALFDKGVISTGRNEKGDVLKLFLIRNHIKPTQIIFVDDQVEKLKSVEQAAGELNIPFTGIHYTRADKTQ